MVIAQVTPVYPPYRGGIGSVAEAYARDVRERGFDSLVFTPEYKKRGERQASPVAGLRPREARDKNVMRLRPWYAWGNAALLPQLFWKLRSVDLIHLHYPFYYGTDVIVALSALVFRRPLIITYHMRTRSRGWLDVLFRLHRALFEPFVFAIAKKILVSSLDYAQVSGLSTKKLVELPFGVDIDRFTPGRDDEWRAAHHIPRDRTVMIFVGGLDAAHAFKGVDVLLRACSMIENVNWHLLVVGDGDRKLLFEDQARELGIADRVTFVGSVHFAELPRAYRAADLHVLPSLNGSEAFGLVTLEAAASGLPSIVSDLSGTRTLIIAGETGQTVPPNDAAALSQVLRQWLENQPLLTHAGIRARERAEKEYDRTYLADQLMRVYNEYL